MTGSFEEWLALIAVVAAVACAVYALRLRAKLHNSERQLRQVVQKFESQAVESKRLSNADPLTGLANRRLFDEVLEKEWARAARSKQPLAVIMSDIDRFKLHNDTYGHQAGDECIRQVTAVLKNSTRRPADLVARYGGEEFSVILPNVDIGGAAAVAERMRMAVQSIKLPHVNSMTGHDVTISLGVAVVVPDLRISPATLVAAADEALYQAKAVGRNQVIIADTSVPESETITL